MTFYNSGVLIVGACRCETMASLLLLQALTEELHAPHGRGQKRRPEAAKPPDPVTLLFSFCIILFAVDNLTYVSGKLVTSHLISSGIFTGAAIRLGSWPRLG